MSVDSDGDEEMQHLFVLRRDEERLNRGIGEWYVLPRQKAWWGSFCKDRLG